MARGSRLARLAALGLLGVVTLAGCDVPNNNFWRFGWPAGVTDQAQDMRRLWTGSVIAALIVGFLVWGLIGYSVIRHRKRGDELPRQTAYNLPLEIVYTIIPFVIITFLFFFTVDRPGQGEDRQRAPRRDRHGPGVQVELAVHLPGQEGQQRAGGEHGREQHRDPDPGAPDRQEHQVPARVGRRHPLVLGAGVPVQARRDPGQRERPRQRLPGDRARQGRLRGPLRRALRHLPRVHELRGPRGLTARTSTPTSRPASPGCRRPRRSRRSGSRGRRPPPGRSPCRRPQRCRGRTVAEQGTRDNVSRSPEEARS